MKKRVVITCGYFDPLHIGHLECFELSKKLAGENGKLMVILNNDFQCKLKKGGAFMPENERKKIIEALKPVEEVFISIDKDKTCRESLRTVAKENKDNELIFTKGGDRFSDEVPEAEVCKEFGIKMVDGLGDKVQSSSWLIEKSEKNGNKNT
ncbi:cytidyltransferase [Candidatus Pacearchaeota archaeon CG10_big_fil_rev_8_21_14_0_10_34_12]|nr:MAG: cytidyltransferase [Candidatus Pacearchaeota archaeon CG10_big_fil_rev_8_21_14_0_10_34_12]